MVEVAIKLRGCWTLEKVEHQLLEKKTFEIDSTLGIFDSSELQNQKMKNLSLKFSKDSWDFNLNFFVRHYIF